MTPILTAARPSDAKGGENRNQVIVSNAPQYMSNQLMVQCENAVILPVTKHTRFKDIVARTYHEGDQFIYEERQLLQALKNGQTVILTGEISYVLYQQLLPLLSNPPRFYSNGEW